MMNLRSAYFSDWKGSPTVLFWGNSKGLLDLRDLLRDPTSQSKALGDICEAVDGRKVSVRVVADRRDTGVHLRSDGMEWRLRLEDAEDFADKLDGLASSSVAAHQ